VDPDAVDQLTFSAIEMPDQAPVEMAGDQGA
jgi:hypothetical protein